MDIAKTSDITVSVGLDPQGVPARITWNASDALGTPATQESKAILLAFFDADTRDTLKIDLWTKEMMVEEMDKFMYQTLRGLADTYYKATQNTELANQMQQFIQHFGEVTKVIAKK